MHLAYNITLRWQWFEMLVSQVWRLTGWVLSKLCTTDTWIWMHQWLDIFLDKWMEQLNAFKKKNHNSPTYSCERFKMQDRLIMSNVELYCLWNNKWLQMQEFWAKNKVLETLGRPGSIRGGKLTDDILDQDSSWDLGSWSEMLTVHRCCQAC